MNRRIRSVCVAIAVSLLAIAASALAEGRTWTDSSGKHKREAELISATQSEVQLRLPDGKEITVALKRLSAADRAFVRKQLADEIDTEPSREAGPSRETGPSQETKAAVGAKPHTKSASKAELEAASKIVREIAERFYSDLRTKERDDARGTLTEAAQAIAKNGKSPLAQLATPDASPKAIKHGRAQIEGTQAEVPVQIRVGDVYHKTTLHLRLESNQWRVFAISATLGDDERTLDFESEAQDPAKQQDPLQALVGQPIRLEGFMLDGTPLDMSQFEGKVVLIDFWATWCGPCRKEMPNILANWQQYHEAGFEVIAISVDKDLGELQQFLVQENPPWTVLADRHPRNRNSMAAAFGIRGIPAFILVGKDGKVAAVHCRGKRLGEQLEKLLGG